jgi:hypothetical protein
VADQICRINIQTLGSLHGIAQLKGKLAAPILTERNILTPLRLFIMTSPINKAVASGHGNKLYIEKQRVKFKITLDCHNTRQKLIYCLIPDPPNFLLPSTFNAFQWCLENNVSFII